MVEDIVEVEIIEQLDRVFARQADAQGRHQAQTRKTVIKEEHT